VYREALMSWILGEAVLCLYLSRQPILRHFLLSTPPFLPPFHFLIHAHAGRVASHLTHDDDACVPRAANAAAATPIA
jgi:hypothetical protein